MALEPPISVVVSTRNRDKEVAAAVAAVLRNDYPDFEVRVIDQSDGAGTEDSLRGFLGDPRFRYVRTAARGLSAGRNLGIEGAANEIIALTDDDCLAPPDWLRELAASFRTDGRIGIVFGNVEPGPHDPARGFIPSYARKEPYLARGILDKRRVEGISACMGLKKSVWKALHGFDERLGAGAPFRAAEETDFTIRTLLAGHYVLESPAFSVRHMGFRTWEEGRGLIEGYLYGIGAALVKNLKCGHGSVLLASREPDGKVGGGAAAGRFRPPASAGAEAPGFCQGVPGRRGPSRGPANGSLPPPRIRSRRTDGDDAMKVCMLSIADIDRPYGSTARPYFIGKHLARHGIELIHICERLPEAGTGVKIISRRDHPGISGTEQAREIRHRCRQFAPDLVYSHQVHSARLGMWISRSLKKPHVFDAHSSLAHESSTFARLSLKDRIPSHRSGSLPGVAVGQGRRSLGGTRRLFRQEIPGTPGTGSGSSRTAPKRTPSGRPTPIPP